MRDIGRFVRKKGKEHGFVIGIGRSDNGSRNSMPRMMLTCERWGFYKEKKNYISSQELVAKGESGKMKEGRECGSKKCGCMFSLKAKQVTIDGEWKLDVVCGVHNHPIAQSMLGYSYAGRLQKNEEEYVVKMSHANSRPKDILYGLKEKFPENQTCIKTVYNICLKNKVNERAARTELQQLMFKLNDHGFFYEYRQCNETNTIKGLFFAHPDSVALMQAFPYVLLMDCTYKTNRYKLPLLEIVGVTSTKMTFLIIAVYLEAEKEANFTWALEILKSLMDESCLPNVIVTDRELALMNAIHRMFPTTTYLLCRWHINRNVLAKCKKMFELQETWEAFILQWNLVAFADTEDSFKEQLQHLSDYFRQFPNALKYVMDTWIVPYKERFVGAWTNKILHFDNLTTNRVESQHALLKKQLGSSQGSFETCWVQFHKLIEISHNAIIASFEKSRTVVKHKFNLPLFSEIRGMVSTNALDLIYNSVNAFFGGCQDNLLCNCFVKSACGLPCPHEVAEYTRFGSHIPLDRVHAYWRKLDILPIKSFDNDIEEELRNRYKECWDTINERFEEATRLGKILIVRRLTEICYPETLMVNEPEVKTNNKGRPKATKAQILHSTKRNPSAFEYVNVIPNQVIFNQTSTKLQPVRRKTQVAKQLRYLDQIPLNMCDFVENAIDVDGDGNCGFRSIAVGLGQGTDAWPRIRVMIWQGMFNHKLLYGKLLMSKDRVDKVLDRIGWYNGPCGEAHWFDAPERVMLLLLHSTLF